MKKIFYLLQDYGFFSCRRNTVGGYIAHIIGVVEAFQRLGSAVVIGAYDPVPYLDTHKVRYYLFTGNTFPLPKVGELIRQWHLTNQIIQAVSEESPDFLYVRWTPSLFFKRVRAAHPNLSIVLECNTPQTMHTDISRPHLLHRWLARTVDQGYVDSATLISVVSTETKELLLGQHRSLDPQRVVVNPNGVNVERFRYVESDVRERHRIPQDAVVLGWAGNFQPWHRIDLLIEAFQTLNLDNVYLMIMGTGSTEIEQSLRFQAAKLRSEQIIFTDAIPFAEMPAHLSACDILVAPLKAKFEEKLYGSPIKLFEYMSVGRAVVASRIGQVCQVIDDGRNGLLFEPDSLKDLERVLRTLVGDRALRERLGRSARRDVEENHSWEFNVQRILAGLERCSRACQA
jgi:glycosyltransferase involved in cell wall biosynthesis